MPARLNAVLTGKHLLLKNEHIDIIVNSLKYLIDAKENKSFGFVIMGNHIHIIWQQHFGFIPSDIQGSFMKHTSKQLKASLVKNDLTTLETYKVNKYERDYLIWKRNPLSIELKTASVFNQKLNYINQNPVMAGLCSDAEEYYYSSAGFYHTGFYKFHMLIYSSGN